jgi:sugar lactone lactonase YvrE
VSPRAGILVRTAAAATALLVGGCGRPAGVIFDPDNARYVWPAPPDQPRIRYLGDIETDQDLKPARRPGRQIGIALFGKDEARGMLSPLAVCTDGADRLFVADSNAQVVHVFNLGSRAYEAWRPPAGAEPFSLPVAVAWDPGAARLLVCDAVGRSVLAFDSAGKFAGILGRDHIVRPCGVAVAPDGRIFIADAGLHQVVVLNREGAPTARVGGRGVGLGEFNFPTNVALDGGGRLYVSDSLNFRIQVFGPDLLPIREIGRKGDVPGTFAQPKGIAIDPEGHLYVVDAHFEAVQVFDPEGTLLLTFGREGRGPGEFWLPSGIHVDSAGRIWVADSYNRRVQAFQYLAEERPS